jgi:S-DNA-T family DNA segregation ATPase FtsK/SpoIIIE
MRRMRLTSSPLDGLPDAARDFASRRAVEAVGAGLVIACGAIGLALATWSVSDPSINHATSASVHNYMGYPGAVISDVMMQMIGLASSAALMPPMLWGMRLLWRRGLASPFPRLALWLIGTLAAAGFASACPTSARWPLPTGLGGVAGDALLGLFASFSLAHGVGRLLIAGIFAIVAILSLTASVSSNAGAARSQAPEEDEKPMPSSRGAQRGREDFEDEDAEPGLALLSAGALAHAFLSAKGALVRRMRNAAPAGQIFDPTVLREPSFAAAASEAPAARPAQREAGSRIQIHNVQPARLEAPRPEVPPPGPRPSPMDLPGAKLAVETLVRKAGLLTHARRLARAMTGGGGAGEALDVEPQSRIEPELSMPAAEAQPPAKPQKARSAPTPAPKEADEIAEPEEAPVKKRVATPPAAPKTGQRLAKEAQP